MRCGMQQNRSSGAALKSGASLRTIMYAKRTVPTTGIRIEKMIVGMPPTEAAAGEVRTDSISNQVPPYFIARRIVFVAVSHSHHSCRQRRPVGASSCCDSQASLSRIHKWLQANQESSHIMNPGSGQLNYVSGVRHQQLWCQLPVLRI